MNSNCLSYFRSANCKRRVLRMSFNVYCNRDYNVTVHRRCNIIVHKSDDIKISTERFSARFFDSSATSPSEVPSTCTVLVVVPSPCEVVDTVVESSPCTVVLPGVKSGRLKYTSAQVVPELSSTVKFS